MMRLTQRAEQRPREAFGAGNGRKVASGLLSSAAAVGILMVILALLYRVGTGQSPWPVFVLVEIPTASVAFALLAIASPR